MRLAGLILACSAAAQTTTVDLGRQGRNADFSAFPFTRTVKTGTAAPATCTVGDLFFDSDATPGANVYGCTATNTWTLETGGASAANASQSFTAQTSVSITHNLATSNVLAQCYNASDVAIEYNSLTVNSANAVTVTFAIAQTGRCVVNGLGGTTANVSQSFTAQTSVALNHNLNTVNILVHCYNASDVAIEYNSLTINSATAATVTFAIAQTGRCVANGFGSGGSGGGGGGGHTIQDEGSGLTQRTGLNFTGAGITCSDDSGNDRTNCNVPSGSGMAEPGSNGVVVRTGPGTTAARTLTAGAGITVSQGDGVAGNPAIAIETNVVVTKLRAVVTWDPSSIAAGGGTCASNTLTISGVQQNDTVVPNRPNGTEDGLDIVAAATATDTVVLKVCNRQASGAIDPAERTYTVTVIF